MPVTTSNPAGVAPTNNLGDYATTFAQDKGITINDAYTGKNSWDAVVKSLVSYYSYESELSSLYGAYQNLQKNTDYLILIQKLVNNTVLTSGEVSLHNEIIANRLSTYYYTRSKDYVVYIIDSLAAKIQRNASSFYQTSPSYPLRSKDGIVGDKSPRVDRIIDSINFVRFTKREKDRHDLQVGAIYNRVKSELWDSGKKDDYAKYVIGLGINYPYK